MDYIKAMPKGQKLQIVEVGCGTGAGANLITREVHPTSNYLALDMQAAAINTCKRIHATADNKGLTCQLIPNGVGLNGRSYYYITLYYIMLYYIKLCYIILYYIMLYYISMLR